MELLRDFRFMWSLQVVYGCYGERAIHRETRSTDTAGSNGVCSFAGIAEYSNLAYTVETPRMQRTQRSTIVFDRFVAERIANGK